MAILSFKKRFFDVDHLKNNLFIYINKTVLLKGCAGSLSRCRLYSHLLESGGCSLEVQGLLTMVAFLAAEHGLQGARASAVAAPRL